MLVPFFFAVPFSEAPKAADLILVPGALISTQAPLRDQYRHGELAAALLQAGAGV